MDTLKNIQTLMGYLGLDSSRGFEAYYNEVLMPYETQRENLSGFTWDIPQPTFDYKQLQVEGQIKVMATYVDAYSEPIPLGSKGLSYLEGSMLRQKAIFRRDEADMRALMNTWGQITSAVQMTGGSPMSFQEIVEKEFIGGMFELLDQHTDSMNYQRGQMASKGMVTIESKNNPRGIKGITLSAQVPTANYIKKEWFEKESGGEIKPLDSADPVGDLRDFVHVLRRKYRNIEMEVNAESFYQMMKHPKWQVELGYLRNPVLRLATNGEEQAAEISKGIFEEEMKTLFRQFVGIPVTFDETVCGVERWDNDGKELVRDQLDAFEPWVFAIRPTGGIGTIKNAFPVRPDEQAISTFFYGNRGIIEYRYDRKFKTQEWVSELTALCVPNRPNDMYFLNVLKDSSTMRLSEGVKVKTK